MQQNNPTSSYYAALGVAGQMGCLMLFIAIGALGVGLLLDHLVGSGHLWVLVCIFISIPANLGVTLFLTTRLLKRVIPPDTVKTGKKVVSGDDEES